MPTPACSRRTTAAPRDSVTSSARVYQSVSRKRSDSPLHESPPPIGDQLIAFAAPRPDHGLRRAVIELAAQPLHVHVDDVRDGVVVIVPDVFGDIGAGDHVSRTPRQILEQRVFLARQRDVMTAEAHATAAGVERQRADHQPLGQQRLAAAADQRPKPREQLAKVERFDEVVVRAAIQALDPRVDGIACGQHQDRHERARFTNRAADGEAVLHRQHDVEDDGIVVGRPGLEQCRLAVGGHVDGVGLLAKAFRQHKGGARLVFDQEDAHGKSLHHAPR